MNILQRLAAWFALPIPAASEFPLAVRCQRCGEVIAGRVNLANELSEDYSAETQAPIYVCRKLLSGRQRCFQQIEVVLTFDAQRRLIDKHITGGQFVDSDPPAR